MYHTQITIVSTVRPVSALIRGRALLCYCARFNWEHTSRHASPQQSGQHLGPPSVFIRHKWQLPRNGKGEGIISVKLNTSMFPTEALLNCYALYPTGWKRLGLYYQHIMKAFIVVPHTKSNKCKLYLASYNICICFMLLFRGDKLFVFPSELMVSSECAVPNKTMSWMRLGQALSLWKASGPAVCTGRVLQDSQRFPISVKATWGKLFSPSR